MKKFLIIGLLAIVAYGGYYVYRIVMPNVIAHAVVSESIPAYIPKRLKMKVEEIRAPINKGTEAMLETMHESDIPLDQVLDAVDNITEEQAETFLEEVNNTKPSNTNEVFDLARKHFPTDFDAEVFREPFNEYFEMKHIKRMISYANLNRQSREVDITTVKAIVKKVLIEKDQELRQN